MKSPLLQGLMNRYVADGSTPPRHRPAAHRQSLEGSDAQSVGRSAPSAVGRASINRRHGSLPTIHVNSPMTSSNDQTPKAVTNRLRFSSSPSSMAKKSTTSPAPNSSNISPLLSRAHSRRKSSLTPPKKVQHPPRTSYGAVPDSHGIESAPSLETLDTFSTVGLTLSGSASLEEVEHYDGCHNDDFTAVASVLSTASIASALNMSSGGNNSECIAKPVVGHSNKVPNFFHEEGREVQSGDVIANLDEVQPAQAKQNNPMSQHQDVVDATTLLASLNIDASKANQAEIALLTKAISNIANHSGSGDVPTEVISCDAESVTSFLSHGSTSSRRQELERLKKLKINLSVAKKENEQKKTTEDSRRGTITRNAINRATAKAAAVKNSPKPDPVEAFRSLSPKAAEKATGCGRSISRTRSILLRSTSKSRAAVESKTAKPTKQTVRGSLARSPSPRKNKLMGTKQLNATKPMSPKFRGRSVSRTRQKHGGGTTVNVAPEEVLPRSRAVEDIKAAKPPKQTVRGRSLSRTRMSLVRSPSSRENKVLGIEQPNANKPMSPKFRGRSISRTRQKLGAGSNPAIAPTSSGEMSKYDPRGQVNHCPPVSSANTALQKRVERRKKRKSSLSLSPPRP